MKRSDFFKTLGIGIAAAVVAPKAIIEAIAELEYPPPFEVPHITEFLSNSDFPSKNITLIKPNTTPLDTLLREMGNTIPVEEWKTEYYEAETEEPC